MYINNDSHAPSTRQWNISPSVTRTSSCNVFEDLQKYTIHRTRVNTSEVPGTDSIEDDIVEPYLANWNKWLKIHKQQQNKLSVKLKRDPECMLMNSNPINLDVNQDKNLIMEASSFNYCDKYRGHPNFWMSDDNFKSNGKKLGIYHTIQKKYDRSSTKTDQTYPHCPHPTKPEYVGIPELIYKEKGLQGPCLPTPKMRWDKLNYVAKTKKLLKEKLNIIQGHVPELSNVAILGKGLGKPVNLVESTNSEKISYIDSQHSLRTLTKEFEPNEQSKMSFILFTVGDKEFTSESKLWTVHFDDCFINEIYEKCVTIFNKSEESSLRYSWEMVLPSWVDNYIPLKLVRKMSKCFYFDKNDGVILPGDEKKLNIYFRASVAGVFCEKFELLFSHAPDQWQSVAVEIQSVAIEREDNRDSLKALDSYLESCTRFSVVRKTVTEILERNRPEQLQELPYDWKLFEEQIFLYNNPDLYYDSNYIQVLKDLFKRINEGPWDYSVKHLRKQLLQKPANEDTKDEFEIYTTTVYKLMKPNIPSSLTNEKFKTVYELLCCLANKIESEATSLAFIYNIPVRSKLTLHIDSGNSSIISSKLNAKNSQIKKISVKKSMPKSKSLFSKSSIASKQTDSLVIPSEYSVSNSTINLKEVEFKIKKRKEEFLEALYIKIYSHLEKTIDQISLVIESFNNQRKKTAIYAIKCRQF